MTLAPTSARVVMPTSVPITWRPYDVVDLEPIQDHLARTIRSWVRLH